MTEEPSWEPTRLDKIDTVVFDEANHVQVAFLPGAACMPVGSVVELANPNRDATVIETRLLVPSTGTATVLLIVDDPREANRTIPRTGSTGAP